MLIQFSTIRISGSLTAQGDLLSLETIDISGSSTVHGNITGTNVILGRGKRLGWGIYKHSYKVNGNILARNVVNLFSTFVKGDVKGRDIEIGKGTEISGTIYYVDNIRIHEKTILANDPVQIKEEDLHY